MASPADQSWPAQLIADALADPVAMVDLDDRVIAWNRAMADLVEIPASVALGNAFGALDISYRASDLRGALENVKRSLEPVVVPTISFSRRDGAQATVRATLTLARDDRRIAILLHLSTSAVEDRTLPSPDAQELEAQNEHLLVGTEELLALNEELRATRDHLETELARALASHADTAVTARAASALLALARARTLDDDAVNRGFSLLQQTPQLEPRALEELADLEALACRKVRLKRAPVALDAVAVEAADRVTDTANMRGIRLDVSSAESVIVRADRRRLEQIASALIGNAIRFTAGGGRVDIAVRREGPVAQLTVADSGCGFGADLLPRVFEPFCRGHGPTAAGHRGLGIRLAIARGLVELHGGAIRADSPGDGRGTTMTVVLPAG